MESFTKWNSEANKRVLKSVRSWRLWLGFPIALFLAFPFFLGGDMVSWGLSMIGYGLVLTQTPERFMLRFLIIVVLLIAALAFMKSGEVTMQSSNLSLQPSSALLRLLG